MQADIQVNSVQYYSTVQNGVREYCFAWVTCRGSSQLSLPLRQIPALMISILQIQKTFCVSTGKRTFTSLRNKCNRDKKIVGKKVSGICRAAKAAGEFRPPSFWKRTSSHTSRLHSGAHCAYVCQFPCAYATSVNIRYAYFYACAHAYVAV